mgnify:FL=1
MRPIFSQLNRVNVESDWFQVFKLDHDIYALVEPYHFQEVISYLILGQAKALLWDTGMGIDNIKQLAEGITAKEISVLNSHTHFDHVGDNHRFQEVMVFNHETAISNLKKGHSLEELKPHTIKRLFEKIPNGFDLNKYQIEPSNPAPIEDGDIIDLGQRKLKVIHTPGHSDDSIMLWDLSANVLFTGDSYYPGLLYAHFRGDITGESRLEVYAQSMALAARLIEDNKIETLHPSHNEPIVGSGIIKEVAQGLKMLAQGQDVPGEYLQDPTQASLPEADAKVDGYQASTDLFCYDFGSFKVIAPKIK